MASAAPETHIQENGTPSSEKQWYDFVQVVITELNDTHLTTKTADPASNTSSNTESPVDTAASSASANDRFYIEEPYDYIFEPDHYPKPHQQDSGSETSSMEHVTDKEGESKSTDMSAIKNENKFTYATVVGENNGFLEYEYKNYTYRRHLYTNKLDHNLDLDSHLLNDYIDNHLNALIRGVSLCKWPGKGFGFELAKQSFGPDKIFFICGIQPDSPADFGLRLGDILIEVDDLSTHEHFADVADIEEHLSKKESVHPLVIHESKYHFVKSNTDFLRNHQTNCEDIVIVSHSR